MSENGHTIQIPPTQPFRPLSHYHTDHPSTSDTDPSRPLETYANELTTNIIKDASETVSHNHDENMDNPHELNSHVHQTSKQHPSETTTTNGHHYHHSENEFDDEEIQKKMNGVIHDIQSGPTSRKSVVSNHLNIEQANTSTPTIHDPSTNVHSTEAPVRSISEPVLDDHHVSHERASPLPIQQDESTSDVNDIMGIKAVPNSQTETLDDFIDRHSPKDENHTSDHRFDNTDEFFNTKVGTTDDDHHRSVNAVKPTTLDETSRFDATSSSRAPSVTSKRSVHATPDEPSTSGDEKRTIMSPSKLPDDGGNDTDRDNREVANIARRPSRAESPLNRPRSPTPNDSRKMSVNQELSPSLPGEHSQSSADLPKHHQKTSSSPTPSHDHQEKQGLTPSRRESAAKLDQQQRSRPTSATQVESDENLVESSAVRASSGRTHQFSVTDGREKLIKPGEQIQIPTNDLDHERSNSPSALTGDIQSLALVNPLLGSSLVQKEQDRSRPPSAADRNSPTTSMMSNAKVIDGDILPSSSRRGSNLSQQQQQTNSTEHKPSSQRSSQVIEHTPPISGDHRASHSQEPHYQESHDHQHGASRRTSEVPKELTSHQESLYHKPQTPSPRESTATEQKSPSRKDSVSSDPQVSSKRVSVQPEHQTHSRHGSTATDQHHPSKPEDTADEHHHPIKPESVKPEHPTHSRHGSTASEQHHPSKEEHRPASRRESTHEVPKPPSRKVSINSEQQVWYKTESPLPGQESSSRRGSTHEEPKIPSRKVSTTSEQHVLHKRESPLPGQQQPSSRRESKYDEPKIASRRDSTASDQKPVGRKESTASEQHVPSKHPTEASHEQSSSRRESTAYDERKTSRKGSTVIETQHASQRESTPDAHKVASRRSSTAVEHRVSSGKQNSTTEEPLSHRRESHVTDKHSVHHRQSSFNQQEQKVPSKAGSRKASVAEQQQQDNSRRLSTNTDNPPISSHRSSNVRTPSSQESSRRNSLTKQGHLPIPVLANNDGRRTSLTIQDKNSHPTKHESHLSQKDVQSSDVDDVPFRKFSKPKQNRTATNEKRRKSSSTTEENNHHHPPLQRKSQQEPKQPHSNLVTDETVVTPIIADSSKAQQQNGKHTSTKDPSREQTQTSKFPPVNSLYQQEQSRHFGSSKLPSSHATTSSEDEQATHWTKQITNMIPPIHLDDDDDDDENPSSREGLLRPQSPNVDQIAERNPVPPAPVKLAPTRKKPDGKKPKEQQRPSRRNVSADSEGNIPLVDDNSLDSRSENTPDVDLYKRRPAKPKKKDVETNTDPTLELQRSLFDDRELTSKKPLKATQPMFEHLHSSRRRSSNKEQAVTSPDTAPDTDRSSARRTVKHSKDSHKDKDPVHVNVTVVVKKFAGASKDEAPTATTETVVEQKPLPYFEHVQHPPESHPPPTESNDKSLERPKSTERQTRVPSSEEKLIEYHGRHTQSDTEQVMTNEQMKRRRPKRISRTCQTYEGVFRRMEREQQQELRATSDTEKTIQTRKSQLRPRKKSPKKNLPIYLSTDSFKLEEVLPKQYHQSRRNMSKSSSIARSLSPQGGKLLILRPTLPFHHTDAVNVQRVCLQYAIDLIPNENPTSASSGANRNKPNVFKQSEQPTNLPMISGSPGGTNPVTNKSSAKDKAGSHRSDEYIHPRRNGGAV